MTRRLEAAHRSFALPARLMGILGTIVQALVLTMLDTRHDFLLGRLVASQLVRDQHTWDVGAAFEQFTKEFLRRSLVPTALHQDIEHIPMLINSPPEVGGLTLILRKTSSKCHLSPVLARRRRS